MKSKFRLFVFRLLVLIITVGAIEAIGYLAFFLNNKQFDFLYNKSYLHIRAMLLGTKDSNFYPRYLSLPYLGYVPYPGYKKNGVIQHNEDGYRGKLVFRQKASKYRILCLGGSTTYGTGVDLPDDTYPAQLEKLLNTYFQQDSVFKKSYDGVEVINGGLEAGNSAEELAQYLFKYRYYSPNIVIIHSGINDAQLVSNTDSNFQFDYTQYRRLTFHKEALWQPAKFLMKSYFISYIVIRLFYSDLSEASGDEFQHHGYQTYCNWSRVNIDSVLSNKQYLLYPFYRNTKSLYAEIQKDSATIIAFPNTINPTSRETESYIKICNLNSMLSQKIAQESGAKFVQLNVDSIDKSFWIDECHLNATGEIRKAQILYPHVCKVISNAIL